ncbi:MBL fold metallo-hydrolase [Aquimarina sp. 2201CG5-10]|uniref:MBL fold metallo-hydrolase n=1 Tax=Aquimarina callyspongiae TaxID=3098150 RepID=UPI002AB5D95A|nr:MBL fold metallo-hydrolase [Aquimarina sp. 2201CG5-10]MDY8135431.1 MBL fold metallo-hydrolase [Aquimarina sp. 2201CG5-10]
MKISKIKGLLFVTLLTTFIFGYSQEANVQKITDNVYSISIFGYNSLTVIGDKGVLLVDPANDYRAGLIQKEIAKLTELPVTHIVLSHEHYDHAGGTGVFPEAQIYAQSNARSIFKLDVTGTVPEKVHNWFDTDATIMMGNKRVDLHHYGAGDGVASTVVHLPIEGIVYCVDMFVNGAITDGRWIEDSNPLGVRLILNNLTLLKPKFVVNGHTDGSEANPLDPKYLIKASQFYNDLYDAVAPVIIEASQKGFAEIMEAVNILPKTVELNQHKDLKNYDSLPTHVHRMAMAIFHGG